MMIRLIDVDWIMKMIGNLLLLSGELLILNG